MTSLEKIEAAISNLVDGNSLGFSQNIQAALMDKLVDRMEIEKINVASKMFGDADVEQQSSEDADA
jgi:hypothetical protein